MSNDANPLTAPLPSSTSEVRRNAYLQGRLYLGMLNVGSWVVFATLLLASGVLESLGIWLAKPGLPDFAALSMMVLGFCLMQLPFDWLGGHWLPRRYGLPSHFTLPSYCMAVFKHSLIFSTSINILHVAGQHLGLTGALGALLVLMMIGVQSQHLLARWLGCLKSRTLEQDDGVLIYEGTDTAFSGGISGWPGLERVILNQSWQTELKTNGMAWLKDRRRRAIRSGLRMNGLLWAIMWISSSFIFAAFLAGFPGGDVAATMRMLLYGVFFHFGGLLLLPSLSRRGSLALDGIDSAPSNACSQTKEWTKAITILTDGEERRAPWIERIFHPLPSMENRMTRTENRGWAAWNATRYMLFLSTLAGGLLSRSVHCNIGRPELWIMPPVD
ncbi:hypothetical protein OAE52_00215 [bacterium]|nr:hypothetical protein [bacterium]